MGEGWRSKRKVQKTEGNEDRKFMTKRKWRPGDRRQRRKGKKYTGRWPKSDGRELMKGRRLKATRESSKIGEKDAAEIYCQKLKQRPGD
jgi:hypothetical protein